MRETLRLAVALTLISGTCLAAAKDKADLPKPDRSVVYKEVDGHKLRMHLFKPEGAAVGKRAAIVFFFGGGWRGGSPSQFYPHCKHLASRGMLAMAAEYRVESRHGTSPFECVRDGKSAVRWIRKHAEELGVDPERIVAGGGSAGGHVAACTGTIDGVEEAGEDLSVSSAPNAMVLFNPVADTTRLGYGSERLGADPERLSPVHHVSPGDPPTIIFHGTADTTVAFKQVERFRDAMKAAGNVCELVPFEGKGHGFFNYGRDEDSYPKTVKMMDRFLVERGILTP